MSEKEFVKCIINKKIIKNNNLFVFNINLIMLININKYILL